MLCCRLIRSLCSSSLNRRRHATTTSGVTNEARDYYRFFNATLRAEFLFDCVRETVEDIVPREIGYLSRYDRFKRIMDEEFEISDKLISVLVRLLEQNQGVACWSTTPSHTASFSAAGFCFI